MDRRAFIKKSGLLLSGLTASQFISSSVQADQTVVTTSPVVTNTTASESHPLLLNFNENSLGMSELAKKQVIESLSLASRYPDSPREELITQLAHSHKLETKNIVLGNGSSEIIQVVVQFAIQNAIALNKKVQLVTADPTFNYAELYAKTQNIAVVKVPLTESFDFDLDAMRQQIDSFDGISLVYICNPNNPTAKTIAKEQLTPWIKALPAHAYCLVDEAYGEYANPERFASAIELVKAGTNNVVVAKTFSKFYAMAGLRVGYAVANSELASQIDAFISIDNTNLVGAIAAKQSLLDAEFQQYSLKSNEQSRLIVTTALDELGLGYQLSDANFIFHQIKGDVQTYKERMKAHHVYVGREFLPYKEWNRLSLGTPDEMQAFVQILKQFRSKNWI